MFSFETPLFEDAPVAYSVLDAEGRQLAANQRFYEIFGYAPGTKLDVDDLTHAEHRQQTDDYLSQITGQDDALRAIEKRYVRADGSTFWGRLTARRIVEDGQPLLLGTIENIDEQHRLRTGLVNRALKQSEFVAQVSHELRNPLHTIAGMAELLVDAGLSPANQRQAAVILREASSASSIVSDLLDIGRIDAGNFAVDQEPFSVRNLVDRSVRAAQPRAQAKGLRIHVLVHDAVPINVVGDRRRVKQVLDNLVGNAVKFTNQGSVSLHLEACDETVRFRVEDTGPGIAANFVERLFEPFARANESTSGAGLGLAISLRLAESMGGTLIVEQTSVEGTVFALDLPLADAGPNAVIASDELPSHSGRSARILVVEDNIETQMLAKAQLDRLGYDYDVVGDGFEALRLFDTASYGAILMDWHLPGIDGLETTRRIRQQERREGRVRTPIVSVTARAMAEDIEACHQAGADDFVAKPANLRRISEVLERWTGTHIASGAEPERTDELFVNLLEELGDVAVVHQLGSTFLSELPGRVDAIVVPDGSDDQRVQLAAHTLASTSLMFGADELGNIAQQIEDAARASTVITDEHRHQLKRIAATTCEQMTTVLEALKGAS